MATSREDTEWKTTRSWDDTGYGYDSYGVIEQERVFLGNTQWRWLCSRCNGVLRRAVACEWSHLNQIRSSVREQHSCEEEDCEWGHGHDDQWGY